MDDVKLIASDLDGTLLLEGGEIPPNFWAYVRRLNEQGITFVPASGRPLATLKQMFDKPGYDVAFISDNGALVEYQGDIIHRSILRPDQYLPMVQLTVNETDGVPMVCGLTSAYVTEQARPYEDYFRIFFRNLIFVDDYSQVDEDVVKYSAFFPEADARKAFDDCFLPALGASFSVTLGGPPWVDIMNRGVTKGEALEKLADRIGIESANLMVFGDALNDVEMLAAAKHSYAVSTAAPEVLEAARFRTGSNEELGVFQVLDELLSARA